MKPRGTIFISIISYLVGWLLYIVTKENALFYIMGLFLYINIFTVFHPFIFHYGVMRPVQLGLTSVGLLSIFTGDISFFVFCLVAVIALVFIEKEDIYSFISTPEEERNKVGLVVKRMLATIIMPFSVTYLVLILRPYEDITSLLIVFLYFSTLFVSSKWFDSILSFGIFMLIQMLIFVNIIEVYMDWTSVQITLFFISILIFLIIGYGRKGLLNYASNNKK